MAQNFGSIQMSSDRYRKIVRWSGIYDLAVTAPFMTPWTYRLLLDAFTWLHDAFGLGGTLPSDDTYTMLYANLLGSVVVVWSVLRVRNPSIQLGRYDGTARFLFATWQTVALLSGGSLIIVVFLIPEIAWGVLQWWPVRGETFRKISQDVISETDSA